MYMLDVIIVGDEAYWSILESEGFEGYTLGSPYA
jgi:hypothetical protein